MVSLAGRIAGGRYTIENLLGSGTMGDVYRAHDAELGHDVALKVLQVSEADDLYRFKQEFRVLADVHHPNLVTLHDLVVTPELSFFTMELVPGVDLVTYVRGERAAKPGPPPAGGLERLRTALPQLFDGLEALHAIGRFHRDIKPSNLLVTPAGRVVLVDFGLAFARPLAGSGPVENSGLAGTPAYMAPEQAWGAAPSVASDGYALGVTLYEALTGEPPFVGAATAVLEQKRLGPAPSPRTPVPSTPAELDELVTALLAPDPARRPAYDAIRPLIKTPSSGSEQPLLPSTVSLWEAPFVNRVEAITQLRAALAEVQQGRAVAVRIEGPSGIGKSALARNFIASLERDQRVVVLPGRCYPQESVPFKALDQVIDALSRFLCGLSSDELAGVVPKATGALLRLFPVLGRAPRITEIAAESAVPSEPEELRRVGFEELRELFRNVTASHTLILWIDDLQWGDADSAVFLRTLADPRAAPSLLLLLSHRGEEWEMSAVRSVLTGDDGKVLGRVLALAPLPEADARRLADVLLARMIAAASGRLDAIARESGGNPFLVCELARYSVRSRSRGLVSDDASEPFDGAVRLAVGIGEIVQDRVRGLDEGARRLLSVVAVAGGPCPRTVAGRAAGLSAGVSEMVTVLRNECLLRHSADGEDVWLETYHDRIRECVLESINGERPAIHLALAAAFEQEPEVDPSMLVEHYHGGGDDERAARSATVAAERAYAALAFEQAARLYELALRVGRDESARVGLLRGRADALSQAGRGGDAGAVYREAAAALAAQGGPAAEVLELIRLAAEQYLRSGYIEEGRAALREVLEAVGERYPKTPRRALLSLVRQRLSLGLRGIRYERRDADAVGPQMLRRIDACWAAAEGLIWADGIRSADFQARYTRLALAAGEPTRVVRALCTEAAFHALIGSAWGARRARRALAQAQALSAELGLPLAQGLTAVCAAGAAYLSGVFPEGYAESVRAEEILRTRSTGVAWELTNAHIFANWSLAHMGELNKLRETMPDLVRRARERGDLLERCCLIGGLPTSMHLLADDRLDEARTAVGEAVTRWPTRDFQLPNYFALVSASLVDLYAGDPLSAWRRIEDTWPTIRAVGLLTFRLVRVEARQLRARCALATLAQRQRLPRGAPDAVVRRVRRAIRQIAREDMPWAAPLAAALSASLAAWLGDHEAMSDALRRAAAGFDAAAMRLWAAAARYQNGDPSGTGWLRDQGVHDPDRYAEMLIPIQALRGNREASPVR